jgi:hypothetical protein
MTITRVLLIVLAACLIGVAACVVWVTVDQANLVFPAPENESAFLKTYTPNPVIDRFKAAEFSQQSTGSSSGAGWGFATHEANFEPTVVIKTGDWVALMQAFRDDIASRLVARTGEIVEESGNPADGFQIKYAVGNSQGTVIIEPLTSLAASYPGVGGTGPGKVTVNLHIRLKEKWSQSEGRS